MTHAVAPPQFVTKPWDPSDKILVPQGYGRIDGEHIVYDEPVGSRLTGDAEDALVRAIYDLDVTDPDARLALVETHCCPTVDTGYRTWVMDAFRDGLPRVRKADLDAVRGYIWRFCDSVGGRRYERLPENFVIQELQDLDIFDDDELLAFTNASGMVNLDERRAEEWAHLPSRVAIEELRASLAVVRLLGAHFVTSKLGGDLVDLWRVVYPVERESDCWGLFATYYEVALSKAHVHPQIEFFYDEDGLVRGDVGPHDLIDALTLQLAELIDSGLAVRVCKFKPCRKPFVRQRGRAKHGQYRTSGVMYCREECANAHAQRQSRLRKAQELAT